MDTITERMRAAVSILRRTPLPISEVGRLLQEGADEIDRLNTIIRTGLQKDKNEKV